MNADTIFGSNELLHGAIEKWWDKSFGTPKGELKGTFREVVGYVQREFGKSKTWAIREVRDLFKAYHLVQNNWDAFADYARSHWGEDLTDQQIATLGKGLDGLMGFLTKKYGSTEDAKNEIIESIKSLSFEKWKVEKRDEWKDAEKDIESIEAEAKKMLNEIKSSIDNVGDEIEKQAKDAGIDIHEFVRHIKRYSEEAARKAEFTAKKDIREGKRDIKDIIRDVEKSVKDASNS